MNAVITNLATYKLSYLEKKLHKNFVIYEKCYV
jgi:hypothetical protein